MPPKATQKSKRPIVEDAGPSSKKTRFAADPVESSKPPPKQVMGEEDEGLSGDAFESKVLEELEDSGRSRKGRRVKTQGYESDSSDDGEGVVESRKKARRKGEGKDDDDDLDMFGGEDEKSDDDASSAKKKATKFMSLGEIEGQEFGGDQRGSDDDEEPEDEDEALRRAKKGMGFELSGFNMKDEMEEGKFAEDGTFVRSYDPHQVHDKWMDGLGDDEIKKARRSRKKMEEREKARLQHDEEEGLHRSKEELELELLDWVRPGESVLQTLGRLGADKKKAEAKNGKPKPKSKAAKAALDPAIDVDPGAAHPSQHPENSAIDRVTALASTLMAMGNLHIYEETHRTLAFSVKEAGLVAPDWVPPSAAPPPELSMKYQYRWSPSYLASAPPGGANPDDIFGPYDKEELVSWRDASYFGPAGDRIQLRRMGDSKWSDWGIVV